MIRIPIKASEIEEAKRNMEAFDAIKSYEKMDCKNNYIGFLGEMVFHRYLTEQGINHEWVNFQKEDFNQPDFMIGKNTIDLKTTFDSQMWIQKPIWDKYVFSRLNDSMEELFVICWSDKKMIEKWIENGKAELVERNGRTDYVIKLIHMGIIDEELIKAWSNGN